MGTYIFKIGADKYLRVKGAMVQSVEIHNEPLHLGTARATLLCPEVRVLADRTPSVVLPIDSNLFLGIRGVRSFSLYYQTQDIPQKILISSAEPGMPYIGDATLDSFRVPESSEIPHQNHVGAQFELRIDLLCYGIYGSEEETISNVMAELLTR